MIKSFRVKIIPTAEQIQKFHNSWKLYRKAYNFAVQAQIENFDNENKNRDITGEKGHLFIHKYFLTNQWTAYKKTLDKNELYSASSETMLGAIIDACSACEKFFYNAIGKPPIRDKSRYNEKYCSPEVPRTAKDYDLYLFINKEGEKVYSLYYRSGGPKFKNRSSSISFPVCKNVSVSHRRVYITQLGGKFDRGKTESIRLKEEGLIPSVACDKYSNPRISFDGVDWWLSIGVELPDIEYPINKGKYIGVDVGVSDISAATTDDGEKYINHIKFQNYKKAEARYESLKSALDRKKNRIKARHEGKFVYSNSYAALKKRVDKARIHLNNIKNNNRHNISHSIVSQNPEIIGLESLDIEKMVSTHAGTTDKKSAAYKEWHKRIMDTGMYEIQRQIEYKGNWRGIKVQKVDQYFPSSQLCSVCGYKKSDLTLDDREWVCPQCGTAHDRDVNAAANIRNEAVRVIEENNGKVKKVLKERKKKVSKKIAA